MHLPPHKLGETTGKAFASLEQENQSFLDESIDPWLVQHEEQSWDKLLTEEEKRSDSHTVEFMRLALMRADAAARSMFYHNAMQDGWMNADEVRARENLNPVVGGAGKTYYRPLNMTPVGEDPNDSPKTEPTQDEGDSQDTNRKAPLLDLTQIRTAARRMATDSARRMTKRLAVHARKAAKSPENFVAWLENDLDTDHRAVLVEAFAPVAGVASSLTGTDQQAEKLVDQIFSSFRTQLGQLSPTMSVDEATAAYEATAPEAISGLLNYGDTHE